MKNLSKQEWKAIGSKVQRYPYLPNNNEKWTQVRSVWPKGFSFLGADEKNFYFSNEAQVVQILI